MPTLSYMSLMVLGTASHAGKSIAVTALCRALHRRGIRVAPFKSQNMSLNSFVTGDGAEIGIAQAVQAFAAGVEPTAGMNPVLLKPKGEGISQVVLHGRPYKDLPIREYYRETEFLLGEVLAAYRGLEQRYGNIVVEVPVLGVIPYADIPLPSEDSLSLADKRAAEGPVRIAVIRLPHISNFTDFEPLEGLVPVDYVDPGRGLAAYDCIIIPGTKNTVEDLAVLQESGGAAEILRARERGIPVIGICGGFQMLGKEIHDRGIEGGHGVYPGLGLLPVVTRFDRYEKTTKQVRARANPVGPILPGMGEVTGYEIHMGETDRGEVEVAFSGDGGRTRDGAVSRDGLVFGTYLHGLFQNEGAILALLSFLYRRKGLRFSGKASPGGGSIPVRAGGPCEEGTKVTVGGDPYDQLADLFEAHLDMEKILSFFSTDPS
jgi:cobyric acid synthase